MCESKCASGAVIMCEYSDVRVVRSQCASGPHNVRVR